MDEARRTAMRLKPDVSMLHRKILSWTYDHAGSQPPGEPLRPQRVPDKFQNLRHFLDVFEPLLLMECWAQIQQSKEENEETYECRIVGRQYTDEHIDLEILIGEGVTKDWYLSETAIVLLRHANTQECHLSKVQHFKNSPQGLQATLRMVLVANQPGPQANTTWRLRKIFR